MPEQDRKQFDHAAENSFEDQMQRFHLVELHCPACMSLSDPTKTTRDWHDGEITVLTGREYGRLVRRHARRCRAGRRKV